MDRILDRDQITKEFQPRILARKEPERLAFRMCDTDQNVTFAQLEARANQGAHLFRVCGVGVGDHIMVLMEKQRSGLLNIIIRKVRLLKLKKILMNK